MYEVGVYEVGACMCACNGRGVLLCMRGGTW